VRYKTLGCEKIRYSDEDQLIKKKLPEALRGIEQQEDAHL
jgi:hypothetical protein